MPDQKNLHSDPFETWRPAELHECESGWYISYYVLNPNTNKLVRKQKRFNYGSNITLRRKRAKEIMRKINNKLERGWNPFLEQEAPRAFTPLNEALQRFESHRYKQYQQGAFSYDSVRTYRSYLSNLRAWLHDHKLEECLAITFTRDMAREFLDEIYYDRDNSPRTHNNYLSFISTLGKWMCQRDYLKANPADGITKEREGPKKRTVIPDRDLANLFDYLLQLDPRYHLSCNLMYSCMVRRTELTKLKVEDIHLSHNVLMLPAISSKNSLEQPVTIPKRLIPHLQAHLKDAAPGHYVFSSPHLKPGLKRLAPKKLSDLWNHHARKVLKLPREYQFYSLKDTGITNLLEAGVSPVKVRDQARHADLKMTNKYTPRVKNAAVADIEAIQLPGW